MKTKCNSCQKEKPEYYPNAGICKECAEKMDDEIKWKSIIKENKNE